MRPAWGRNLVLGQGLSSKSDESEGASLIDTIQPYIVITNLTGDKSGIRSRFTALGFHVLGMQEDGEETYSINDRGILDSTSFVFHVLSFNPLLHLMQSSR